LIIYETLREIMKELDTKIKVGMLEDIIGYDAVPTDDALPLLHYIGDGSIL
jgi:hypothetical protein